MGVQDVYDWLDQQQ